MQFWIKRFRDNDFKDIDPLHKKHPGKARKIGPRTLAVLKREVEKAPRISARQLKEMNSQLLSHVYVRTVARALQRVLLYKYRCAWKKPIVTHNLVRTGKTRVY